MRERSTERRKRVVEESTPVSGDLAIIGRLFDCGRMKPALEGSQTENLAEARCRPCRDIRCFTWWLAGRR